MVMGTPCVVSSELTDCAQASVQGKKKVHKAIKKRWCMSIPRKIGAPKASIHCRSCHLTLVPECPMAFVAPAVLEGGVKPSASSWHTGTTSHTIERCPCEGLEGLLKAWGRVGFAKGHR